jgi:branched-chain amino acid transport system substrate-binding protein
MKKLLLIIITMLVLVSCKEETLKIGLVTTLTGSNSEIGIAIRDSLLLKVNEVNDNGGVNGRKVEVIIRDDKNDHSLIKLYNDELFELGVDVYWGYELSSKYVAIEDFLKNDVVVISPTLSSHTLSGKNDNFFRTISTNWDQGETLAKHANRDKKKSLILYDAKNKAYADGIMEGYENVFLGESTRLAVDNLLESESLIMDAYENSDSVILIFNPIDCATVAQLFYKNDIRTQLYSSPWGMISDSYKSAGKAMEGTVFASHIGDKTYQPYVEFVNKYKAYYNEEPQFAAVYSYEAAMMFFEAVDGLKEITYTGIKEGLLDLEELQGVISILEFDDYGDIERKNYTAVLINGELITTE